MNTTSEGKFRYIVFKEGDVWYSVALEFNIVESAEDPKLAFFGMTQAVQGYVDSLKKIKGVRFYPLNQKADSEYESLWTEIENSKSKPIKSPLQIHMYGVSKV